MNPAFPKSLPSSFPTQTRVPPDGPGQQPQSDVARPGPTQGALAALSGSKPTASSSMFASPGGTRAPAAEEKANPSLADIIKRVAALTGPMANAIPASPQAVQRFAANQAAAKATLPDDVHDKLEKQLHQLFQRALKSNGGQIDGALDTCSKALEAAVASYHRGAGVR